MLRKGSVKQKSGFARSVAALGKHAKQAAPSKASAGTRAGKRPAAVSSEERYQMIACAAYFRAEHRAYSCGCAEQDWLEAEAEIDRALNALGSTAANS